MVRVRNINAAAMALCLVLIPALGEDAATADLGTILADSDCASQPCRAAATIEVRTPDGQMHSLAVPRSPYVTKAGTIVVFPGEAAVFDFPSAAGEVYGPPHLFSRIVYGKFESSAPLPKPVIGISFGLFHLGPDRTYTSYRTTANFDRAVLYDVTGTQLVDGKLVAGRTESCVKLPNSPLDSIPPGVTGPVLLGNFRPWPLEAKYNSTHDVALQACHFADGPPPG